MRYQAALRNISLIILFAFVMASPTGIVSAGTNIWTSHGPEGGNIFALAIDPKTPTTLYAGTYGGGVFKRLDGGGHWSAACHRREEWPALARERGTVAAPR